MNQTQAESKAAFSIDPRTRIGHVSLKVKALDSQIRFYEQVIGLKLNWREGEQAGLGAGEADIVRLTEHPGSTRTRGVTGLYHFAILLPNRRELARVVRRLFAMRYRNYPTDHILTKTTYLDDPEGNGIELYAESPEDGTWSLASGEYITRRADGSLSDGREPLDLEALFSNLMEDDKLDVPAPAETRMGHVHLHVRDVEEAVAFYHGVIGFDVMGVARPMQMGFVSAGGYHHHIGLNTWQGAGAPAPPDDALGLRYFQVVLPDAAALAAVQERVKASDVSVEQTGDGLLMRDPSRNGLLLSGPA